jgi:aryl-alcohol dehydrogenase-like predicted oxidoreductase
MSSQETRMTPETREQHGIQRQLPESEVGEQQNIQQAVQGLQQQQQQTHDVQQIPQPSFVPTQQKEFLPQQQQTIQPRFGASEQTVSETRVGQTRATLVQTTPVEVTTTQACYEEREPRVIEPTVNFFNRFVAKDTHCLMGRSGIKVSRITLGTMNFGDIDSRLGHRPGQLDESECHKILDRFFELGGNCIDTADFYPWFGSDAGNSERIIGNWLKKLSRRDRERVFVITKVRMPIDPENINSVGLSRSHLLDSVNASLERLQTDWIDMVALNGWDNTVSFGETVKNLDDLIRSGKIRYVGVCDFKGWQLQKFIDAAKINNLHRCVCYLGEYNLLTRGCELEVLDVCRQERVGFIAYSPLKYGFLSDETIQSGMYSARPGSRIEAAANNNLAAMAESWKSLVRNPINMNVLNYCHILARKHRRSVSQIAIQWLLQSGVVTSVCIGVESVRELDEAFHCLVGDFILSEEDLQELNFQSSVRLHYPYHKLFSEVISLRTVRPINRTEFEQLSLQLSGDQLELMESSLPSLQRLSLRDTVHESLTKQLPEEDFMRHMKLKSQLRLNEEQQKPHIQPLQQQQPFTTPGQAISPPKSGMEHARVIS